jgi:hypothetical protein
MIERGRGIGLPISAVVVSSAVSAREQTGSTEVTAGATSVTTAKTAIRGHVSDPSRETYGVVGVSNAPGRGRVEGRSAFRNGTGRAGIKSWRKVVTCRRRG